MSIYSHLSPIINETLFNSFTSSPSSSLYSSSNSLSIRIASPLIFNYHNVVPAAAAAQQQYDFVVESSPPSISSISFSSESLSDFSPFSSGSLSAPSSSASSLSVSSTSLSSTTPPYRKINRLVETSFLFRNIMIIIYLLTALVAFIANCLAIIILNYGRRTSRQLNYFLSNLGLSDIIFAIFNIPFTYITLIYNTWWLPEFLCPLTSFVQVLAPTVAFYTLIAIGVGRYYVIVTGQESLFLSKTSHTKLVIAIIWILAFMVASPILIATKISPVIYNNETYVECIEDWSLFENFRQDNNDNFNSNSIGTIYTIIVFILTFILPVVALTYLYGHIGIIVYKHQLPTGNDNRFINQNLTQTKVKVLKMLLLLVVSFIICWSPCQIFYLMLWVFEDIRQDPNDYEFGSSYYSIFYYSLYFIFHWLSCWHTVMNPFIYCFFSNNFQRTDLIDIILCRWENTHHNNRTSTPKSTFNKYNRSFLRSGGGTGNGNGAGAGGGGTNRQLSHHSTIENDSIVMLKINNNEDSNFQTYRV